VVYPLLTITQMTTTLGVCIFSQKTLRRGSGGILSEPEWAFQGSREFGKEVCPIAVEANVPNPGMRTSHQILDSPPGRLTAGEAPEFLRVAFKENQLHRQVGYRHRAGDRGLHTPCTQLHHSAAPISNR
jgi:hypothetical protein